jgi:hypothetical protein
MKNRTTTRAGLVAGTVVCSFALAGGPAAAAPPIPLEPEPPLTLEACGTTVTITDVVNMGRIHVKEGEAASKITGRLVVMVSTPDGRSATLNVSGPAKITPTATGIELSARGRNLLFATTEGERRIQAALGIPTLALTSGPVDATLTIDPVTGEFTAIDPHRTPPRIQDVCDLLE